MKKVSSIIALVAMTLSLSSFNTNSEPQNPKDCAREARQDVLSFAEAFNEHPNDNWDGFYSHYYNILYTNCYNSL